MSANHWAGVVVLCVLPLLSGGCDDGSDGSAQAVDAGSIISDSGASDAGVIDAELAPDIQWPELSPLDGELSPEGATDLDLPVPEGQARAGRVSRNTERLTGPEAACRIGDYRLDNARISVCIQSGFSSGQVSGYAGHIVDAHRADRPGTDWLDSVIHAPSLGEIVIEEMGVVRDGGDGGVAVIRVAGRAVGMRAIQGSLPGSFVPPPIRAVTEFHLAPDEDEVEILTWMIGTPDGRGFVSMYDLVMFGDQTRLFVPGTADAWGPFPYVAAEADQVSYGWSAASGPFSLFELLADEIPGGMPIVYESETIGVGEAVVHRRFFRVGTGDVESLRVVDESFVEFEIHAVPGTRIDVLDEAGKNVTRVRIDDEGTGRIRVVPGRYVAQTYQYAGGDLELPFEVTAENEPLVFQQADPARLQVQVQDSEGNGLAARLDIRGTQNGRFFVVDDANFALPAGDYTLTVTRGWHFSVAERQLVLAAGEAQSVAFELEELIVMPGWTSGEFHQHASPSLDSDVAVEQRVLSNVVEGVGFMQPSDHNIIYDYASVVERMGLTDRIAAPMTGIEISPVVTHVGAYGIPYDPLAPAGGAPTIAQEEDGLWRGLTIAELVQTARDMGAEIIQMNHPKQDTSGYFTHSGYGALTDITTLDQGSWTSDFDALEVYNNQWSFCTVFADWMGLLNQGLRITGIGNSDTHSIGAPAGYPRNYMPTMAAASHEVARAEIVGAMRSGQVTVGGGAVLDFPEGPLPGDELAVDEGTISVRVRLRTPPYAQLTQLMVLYNGIIIQNIELSANREAIVDFDERIEVSTPVDGHLVFLATGDPSLEYIRPGRGVFAFSNPIWIDVDGGGVTPVGVGEVSIPQVSFCN